jgi:hypothetical protein
MFPYSTASRQALQPTKPLLQWEPQTLSLEVKLLGRELDHSPPPSAEVKSDGDIFNYLSTGTLPFYYYSSIHLVLRKADWSLCSAEIEAQQFLNTSYKRYGLNKCVIKNVPHLDEITNLRRVAVRWLNLGVLLLCQSEPFMVRTLIDLLASCVTQNKSVKLSMVPISQKSLYSKCQGNIMNPSSCRPLVRTCANQEEMRGVF